MKRMLAAASAILPCLMYASIAHAHYPDRPVRIVVPVAAGGGVDVMARLLAQALSERWGQQFVVENRPGAAGIIGTRAVIASPPDGYTLLYTPSSLALAVVVNKSPPYDVARELSPVINVAVSPYALALHRAVPAASVTELVAYARAHPNALSYGSAGIGSASHLAAELFKSMAGIEMVHVPNKGMNPAVVDLLAGEVQVLFASIPALQAEHADRVRVIAVAESTRSALMPALPTIAESGIPGFAVGNWAASSVLPQCTRRSSPRCTTRSSRFWVAPRCKRASRRSAMILSRARPASSARSLRPISRAGPTW